MSRRRWTISIFLCGLAASPNALSAAPDPNDDEAVIETFSDRTLSPAYHHCLGRNPSTTHLGWCLEVEQAKQETALNAAYRLRMAALPAARRSALRASERAWVKERERRCQKAFDFMEGGTGAGPAQLTCLTTLAVARARWIGGFR
jgi:uncharacterized protein YecT (DUF1311 family)